MPAFIDLTGRKFCLVHVDEYAGRLGVKSAWWCSCACGVRFKACGNEFTCGGRTSCGCIGRRAKIARAKVIGAANKVHGETQSDEWRTWFNMRQRCNNPNHPSYRYYGAKGVVVCARWESFENFLADIGRRPSKQHSLDRFPDPSGPYSPENCRWATATQQNRNKRTSVRLTINGVTKPLGDWSDPFGVNVRVAGARLRRGWPPVLAVSTPVTVLGRRVMR